MWRNQWHHPAFILLKSGIFFSLEQPVALPEFFFHGEVHAFSWLKNSKTWGLMAKSRLQASTSVVKRAWVIGLRILFTKIVDVRYEKIDLWRSNRFFCILRLDLKKKWYLRTNISPKDDFPFPQVGYINCLEGGTLYILERMACFWDDFFLNDELK